MNTSQMLKNPEQLVSFVDSLLVPVVDIMLLLPVSAMAEVIDKVEFSDASGERETGHYGLIEWREQTIPLVSIEAFTGGQAPDLDEQVRFAVLKAFGEDAEVEFYALVIQGYPRSTRVTPTTDLRPDASREEQPPGILMYAMLDEQPAAIPDLAYVESQLTVND